MNIYIFHIYIKSILNQTSLQNIIRFKIIYLIFSTILVHNISI